MRESRRFCCKGAQTSQRDRGLTALGIAAHYGRDVAVRMLLEHGGSHVDAVNNGGETALHLACIRGHAVSVQQLLAAGADATLRDTYGRTASPRPMTIQTASRYCRSGIGHTCCRGSAVSATQHPRHLQVRCSRAQRCSRRTLLLCH